LQPKGARSRLDLFLRALAHPNIGRIDQHRHARRSEHQLTQQFHPLCHQLGTEKLDPRQVSARSSEARDEIEPNRVFDDCEDDGDRRSGSLGRQRRSLAGCDDDGNLSANQFLRECRQPAKLALRSAVFDHDVLALDVAGLLQALAECAQTVREDPITGFTAAAPAPRAGHATAAPPRRVMKSRRLIRSPHRCARAG
jgi:hypothetical protein